MRFRIDFKEKLDLSKFKKQAPHYISLTKELGYDLYLPDYKMQVDIITNVGCEAFLMPHEVTISFYEINRDKDNDIIGEKAIFPLTDTRFKELQDIQNVFMYDTYRAIFNSHSSVEIVDKICKILNILFKINKLKAFL